MWEFKISGREGDVWHERGSVQISGEDKRSICKGPVVAAGLGVQ